jgi:hypothetical protein
MALEVELISALTFGYLACISGMGILLNVQRKLKSYVAKEFELG